MQNYRDILNSLAGKQIQWDLTTFSTPSSHSLISAEFVLYNISQLPNPNLANKSKIAPTINDGIQLEWSNDDKYLEVELKPDKFYLIYYCDDKLHEDVELELSNLNKIIMLLSYFLGRMYKIQGVA